MSSHNNSADMTEDYKDTTSHNNSDDMAEDYEDTSEYLDPSDIQEVIDIDDNTDMDNVSDRLMDVMGKDEDGEQDEEELPEESGIVKTSLCEFKKHTGSVFSCCLSPCGRWAVTGGEDDLAYVWRAADGQVLMECTGHTDSVSHVCVSADGRLIATADMAGLVQVWAVKTRAQCFSFEASDINWLCWVGDSHHLACGTAGSGEVWLWQVDDFTTDTFPGYGAPSLTGAVTTDGERMVVGYEDGKVRILQLFKNETENNKSNRDSSKYNVNNNSKSGFVLMDNCHSCAVTCVATHPDNVLAITGAVDGSAKLVNTNNGKVLDTINLREHSIRFNSSSAADSEIETAEFSVESVGFCRAQPHLAVIAGVDGTLLVYDINAKLFRFSINQPAGVSRLVFSPDSTGVLVGGLDGVCRHYDVLSGELRTRYMGHTKDLYDIAIDKSGARVITASDDGTARVYNM